MIIGLTLAQREKSCIYLGRGHKHQKSMINTSQQNFAERLDIQLKKSAGNSAKAAPKNHPPNWLRGEVRGTRALAPVFLRSDLGKTHVRREHLSTWIENRLGLSSH